MKTREEKIFDRLPEAAKVVMTELRQEKEDALTLSRATSDKENDARMLKADAERQLRALNENVVRLRMPENNFNKKMLSDTIETATADLKRVRELNEVRTHRWQRCGQLIGAIESYVLNISPEVPIVEFKGPGLKAPRGDLLEAVELCRRKILEFQSDLAKINAAPIPSALAKKLARQEIDALAARGEPGCFDLIERRAGIGWPKTSYYEENLSGLAFIDVAAPPIPTGAPGYNALAFYIWHNRDAVIASIERKIEEAADDKNALSDDERPKRRSATLADILALEREEELLIRTGKARGLTELQRRPEADPRAVLSLAN
jgi:hypothetical protein